MNGDDKLQWILEQLDEKLQEETDPEVINDALEILECLKDRIWARFIELQGLE
jgi:hypothetical protein